MRMPVEQRGNRDENALLSRDEIGMIISCMIRGGIVMRRARISCRARGGLGMRICCRAVRE
jgi:hypothetical protein